MEGRLNYISLLRVLAMFLIVIFHSLCFYTGVWWKFTTDVIEVWKIISEPVVNIGLALFIFIAGFLYGYLYFEKEKYKEPFIFIFGKIRRLLIPYLLWGIVCVLLPFGFKWGALFTGVAHLWFLLVLFELFLIMIFISKSGFSIKAPCDMKRNYIFDSLLFVTSFSFVYIWRSCCNHHYVLGIESTLFYLPIMLAGYFMGKYGIYKFERLFLSEVFLFLGVGYLLFDSILDINLIFMSQIMQIFIAWGAIILSQNICARNELGTFVIKMDKFSMGVYVFNQIVIFGILSFPFMNKCLSSQPMMGPFFIFVFSFVTSYLLSTWFSRFKYLSWMIGL